MSFALCSKPGSTSSNSTTTGSSTSLPYMHSEKGTLASLATSISQMRDARSRSNTLPNIESQNSSQSTKVFGHRPSLPAFVYTSSNSSAESLRTHTPVTNPSPSRTPYVATANIKASPISALPPIADHLPPQLNANIEQTNGSIQTPVITEIADTRRPSLAATHSTSTTTLSSMQEQMPATSWNQQDSLSSHSPYSMQIPTLSVTDTSARGNNSWDPQIHTTALSTNKPNAAERLSLSPLSKDKPVYQRRNGEESPPPAYTAQVTTTTTLHTIDNIAFPSPPPSDSKGFSIRQSLPPRPRPM